MGRFLENPPGDGTFAGSRRSLGPDSPLRGCTALAAWATTKIPFRGPLKVLRQAVRKGGTAELKPLFTRSWRLGVSWERDQIDRMWKPVLASAAETCFSPPASVEGWLSGLRHLTRNQA